MTKRILVVDDKNELLHLMRRVLEDEEYQVSILQEGKDTYTRVTTHVHVVQKPFELESLLALVQQVLHEPVS